MSEGEVSLPLYYRETFFAKDSLLHPELPGGSMGVAGDSIPYAFRGDDVITGTLLLCFVVAMLLIAYSRSYLLQQMKGLVYIPYLTGSHTFEGGKKSGILHIFCFLTCVLLAITTYLYVTHYVTNSFVQDTPYLLIAIYCGIFAAYFLCRIIIYKVVNLIFFGSKKSKHWTRMLSMLTALEGVAIFPVIVLQVYADLPMQDVVYYFIFVLFLAKILTFSQCWFIFFRQIGFFLQIILYLCALEIIPLLSLGGVLVLMTDQLKVIY